MLKSLHIENIAVIERNDIDFNCGLNVLTGETGAGKSIVIDSINAVLGERISKEMIRTDAQRAMVTALFTDISKEAKNKLEEMGYPAEDDDVVLSRQITTEGKNYCRISGRPATVSAMRDIGAILLNIHGQHDNQALLNQDKHIGYLDRYANNEDDLAEYADLYNKMYHTGKRLNELLAGEEEKEQKIDRLKYQIAEIEQAGLEEGEEESLEERRKLLSNREKILSTVSGVKQFLSGEEEQGLGAIQLLTQASQLLASAGQISQDFESSSQKLLSLSYEVQEALDSLHFYDDMEYSPAEMERIEERVELLHKLKRKYGATLSDILIYYDNAKSELDQIEFSEKKIEELMAEFETLKEQTIESAKKLSSRRKEYALKFTQQVQKELMFLDMPHVRIPVEIKKKKLDALGMDDVTILISANPGEPPKPVSKIASGGELSRIMLAIKSVMAGKDDIDTLIFDEIDTGVSGRAAGKIGIKLKQIAKDRQVICVTHLAQIACQGESHYLIDKRTEKEKTYTQVRLLDREGRIKELARIMGSVKVSDLLLKNAEEMLEQAQESPSIKQ